MELDGGLERGTLAWMLLADHCISGAVDAGWDEKCDLQGRWDLGSL